MSTTVVETRRKELSIPLQPQLQLEARSGPATVSEATGRNDDTEADNNAPEEPSNEDWNRTTILRLLSVGFAFFVAGVNDGSIGTLVPYIIDEYNVTTNIVSSVYGAGFFGWFLAALTQTHVSQYCDLGLMFAFGASMQVVCQVLRVWRPPFAVFVVSFFFATLGQGYQDTQGNSFVAGVKASYRWLGFIHGMYAGGCLVGPFLANAIASSGASRWPLFYAVPLGMGALNLILCIVAFWEKTRLGRKMRDGNDLADQPAEQEGETAESASQLINATCHSKSVWMLSLFYFFYLGAVLTASGWVVEYLVTVRHGELSKMGYVPAGFQGGSFLGRLLLVEPIHRYGERRLVFIFCLLSLGLQLLFWLVPNIIAASVAISLFGLFTGPFFPVGMSLATRLFSPNIRSTAMGFLFVIAQIGGSLFPIITGVIAEKSSVSVMQPILVGLMGVTAVTWLLIPKPKDSGNNGLHQE